MHFTYEGRKNIKFWKYFSNKNLHSNHKLQSKGTKHGTHTEYAENSSAWWVQQSKTQLQPILNLTDKHEKCLFMA